MCVCVRVRVRVRVCLRVRVCVRVCVSAVVIAHTYIAALIDQEKWPRHPTQYTLHAHIIMYMSIPPGLSHRGVSPAQNCV